ncbi:hypothetical protein Ancab_008997 [Ancistrocladus abbreviatus]
MTFTITTTLDDWFTTNSAWPAPAPSPSELNLCHRTLFFLPSMRTIPGVDSAFEIAAIAVILSLLVSFLSISFILQLRVKSRSSHQLQNFSSHWTIRFLLISFILLWSLYEFPRLPFFRRTPVFPFLPPLSVSQQTHFCKLHIILSLGLFEPGFLVALLFLVNISIEKRIPQNNLSAIIFVVVICFPMSLLLYLSLYQLPKTEPTIPTVFHRSSVPKMGFINHIREI